MGTSDGQSSRELAPRRRSCRTTARLTVIVAGGIAGALCLPHSAGARAQLDYRIVAGHSIGPVTLGESRVRVEAIAGAGRRNATAPGAPTEEFYLRLKLVVSYRSGRVVAVSADSFEYDATPGVALYHTTPDVGVGTSFTRFAALYPHRRCRSVSYMGGPQGNEPFDSHLCIVVTTHGNFTAFGFTGPASEVPDCDIITVGVRSELRAAESQPIP